MPISIKDLAKETRDLAVTLGDQTLTVTYKPRYHTLALEEELTALPGTAAFNAAVFCRMVVAWDLVDAQGKPVPITVEAIRDMGIPSQVISLAIDAIVEDMRPKEPRQNGLSHS
jgi:hypothetical protein